ncbi:MAG: 3'-5' exonuclease [Alphaproteobacteria bacterium]
MKKEFIIFDTEFTTWEGCIVHGWNDWKKREVVQISALKVDAETLEVIEEFNAYVKPQINPILSDYFVELTGLTNELIQEQGIPFEQMYWQFRTFVGDSICYSHAWGSNDMSDIADGSVMRENLCLFGLKDENEPKYANIVPWFKKMYFENKIEIKTQNSGAIAKLLGIENELKSLNLDEHNAIYDCYSILLGIKFFKAKDLKK